MLDKFHPSTKRKKLFFQLTFIVATIWTTLINIMSLRLDPDPHHDGIILSSAMAVNQGKIPNLDFFSQYGPVTIWVNSIFVKIPGYELLTLRVSYFVLAAAIAAILIYSIENKHKRLLLSATLLLWLTSNPVWSSEPTNYFNYWPWPDLLNTLLLSLIYCIKVKRKDSMKYVFMGILITFSFYIKINFGIINSMVLGLLLIKNRKIVGVKNLKIFITTFVAANTAAISLLFLQGSLAGFIEDCIKFPSQTYNPTFIDLLTNVLKMSFNPFTLVSAALLVSLIYIPKTKKILLIPFLIAVTVGAIVVNQVTKPDYFSGKLLYLHVSVAFVETFFLYVLFKKSKEKGTTQNNQENSLALAICAILNLVYIGDIFHLWLNAPLILLAAISVTQSMKIKKIVYLMLAFLYVVNSYSAIENLFEQRVSIHQAPLMGMLVAQDQKYDYEEASGLLKSVENEKIDFACPDGLFQVLTGRFLPDNYNPWFNDLSSNNLKNFDLIICIQNKEWVPKHITDNYTLIDEAVPKTSWSHWSSSSILYFRKN